MLRKNAQVLYLNVKEIAMTRVLFITSNRLGDAVLSTGLLHHVIKQHPKCCVTVACGKLPESLFRGFDNVSEIIPLIKGSYSRHWIDLWKKVVFTRWDIVIDLRDSAVSRLVLARKRHIWKKHGEHLHKVEQNAAVLGVLEKPPAPHLDFEKQVLDKARALIPAGDPILGIGPTANWIGKSWPAERFSQVIDALTAPKEDGGILPNAKVAVFAAPGEEKDAYTVLNSVTEDRRIDLIAKTNPAEAAACIQRCDLYIGNDSGLMHCGVAVNTPTIGLFGPSRTENYRPWGNGGHYVRTPESYEELLSLEGFDFHTKTQCYMKNLKAQTVIEHARAFWKDLR